MTKKEAKQIEDWWNNEGVFQTCNFDRPSYMWPIFVQKAFDKLEDIENDDKKRSTRKIPSMD